MESRTNVSTLCSDIINASLEPIKRTHQHKKELIKIILNESLDYHEKISQLRTSILKYQTYDEPTTLHKTKYENFDGSSLTKNDADSIVNLFNSTAEPLIKHTKLIDKIAETIRDEKLDNSIKIDIISNILI